MQQQAVKFKQQGEIRGWGWCGGGEEPTVKIRGKQKEMRR